MSKNKLMSTTVASSVSLFLLERDKSRICQRVNPRTCYRRHVLGVRKLRLLPGHYTNTYGHIFIKGAVT